MFGSFVSVSWAERKEGGQHCQFPTHRMRISVNVPSADRDWKWFDDNTLIRILFIRLLQHFSCCKLVISNLSVQMIDNSGGPCHKVGHDNVSIITFTDTEPHDNLFMLRDEI